MSLDIFNSSKVSILHFGGNYTDVTINVSNFVNMSKIINFSGTSRISNTSNATITADRIDGHFKIINPVGYYALQSTFGYMTIEKLIIIFDQCLYLTTDSIPLCWMDMVMPSLKFEESWPAIELQNVLPYLHVKGKLNDYTIYY